MPSPLSIERRDAIALVASLLCAPGSGWAQTAERKLRIGILVGDLPAPNEEKALLQGLREHGFVEGRNLIIERGYADGRVQQVPGIARQHHDIALVQR